MVRATILCLGQIAISLAAWGCTAEPKGNLGTDPTKVIASIIILPATVTIPQGTTFGFRFYGITVGGDSVVPQLDWVANGGILGADGEFTSQAAGTFSVIGTTHRAPRVSDTVTVIVTPLIAIDSVLVHPELVTVPPGTSRVFTASAYQSDGSVVAFPALWSATGGTIDAAGNFTAGATLGTFRVDALDPANNQLLDTAAVIIAVAAPTLQKVNTLPAAASLAAGGTQQFTSNGNYSDGSTLPLTVTWTATGGSITGGGLYTAGQVAGNYKVIGTHTSGKADTSAVTVTGTLARISLTPATTSLQFGGTQQFNVIGVRTDSSTTPVTVNYTAGGGSISQGGFYTAGQSAGNFRVIAAEVSTGKADTSSVTVQAPPPVVVSLNLLPATASLLTGGTKQFAAQDVYNNGTTASTTNVIYLASGGTVSAAGLYTAPGVAGNYKVIATSALYGFKDTTDVVVSSPAQLTQIIIAPATAVVGLGGTIPFVATGRLSNGTTNTVQVTWTASGGGSMSPSGLYTAGSTPGAFKVFAVLVGGTLADTADVTVSSTPPPTSNEPAGFTPFAINRLDQVPVFGRAVGGVLGSWYAFPQGNPKLSITTDPSSNGLTPSPDTVIDSRFPTNWPAGIGPVNWGGWAAGTGSAAEFSKVYFSLWVKIEGPDYENQSVGTKLGYFSWARPPGTSENEGFILLVGNGATSVESSFNLAFFQQGVTVQQNGSVNRNLNQNVNRQKLMTCGLWHHWELVMELNGIGNADGKLKMWVDDTQIFNYSDVIYIDAANNHKFKFWKWNTIWGGAGGSKTRDDHILIDHVYISGIP